MESQYLGKNFKLRLVKYFMFSSLSLLMIQDTSSTTDMKCEIRSSCFLSGCQRTDMTVDPDSNITHNCSISTGKHAQGMTWKQARQEVQNNTGLSDLMLLKSNSTKDSGNMTCYCTNINFIRKLQIVRSSGSPKPYRKDVPQDLECHFSGWPLPREVQWSKNGKIITNGTERIYHSEDRKWEKGKETLRSTLHLPPGGEEQEGDYKCSARNSIPGWESEASASIEMIYQCTVAKGLTIDSLEVLAAKSSNVNLSCWIDYDFPCPQTLLWKFNDKPEPLPKSGKKYNAELKDTNSKCQKEFILSIFNVTEFDEGTYSCHRLCDYENPTKAAIDLKVVDDVHTVPSQATTESPTTSALLSSPASVDGCTNYTVLSEADRALGNAQPPHNRDDSGLVTGWYRFQGAAGDRIPDKCVLKNRCGTMHPGWLHGTHPTITEGVVTRTVCYSYYDDCCWDSTIIKVKNCSSYYVYELPRTPDQSSRYCGNAGAATTASILSLATTTLPRTTRTPPRAPPSIYYVDPQMETGTEENVILTCHATGLPQPTFTWITPGGNAVNATAPVYESEVLDDGSENRRGKIVQEDGSLLIFNTLVADQGVYKCVAINIVGQDKKSVNLTVKEDLVGVDVAITIEDEVFDKDLENKSSSRYKKLEKQVEQELTELFKDIEGFEKVLILGFFNGSVKVHFRVVSNVDELEDKELVAIANKVGKALRNSVKTGQIGNLKVNQTVELRELPPAPVNVQSADFKQTEAVVTWSHPELYDMYAISSYSLQVRKLNTKTWTQFTTTRDVSHTLTNLDPDTVYFVRLKSENKYGKGKPSENAELRTKKASEGSPLILALVIIFLLILVIMGIAAVFVYRRCKKKRSKNGYNTPDEEVPMNPVTAQPAETIPHTSTIQASFPWREIPRDRLTLGKILGEGEFGMVVKGELTEDDGHVTPCAVKKLKDCATESDLKDLKNELDIMGSVGNHPNLVNLIGACSSEGQLMIVVEFAEHGNLHRYLRDHRKQNYDDMNKYSLDISSAERLRIACDVAEGMKHLATMRWVHRDLAARNVLLGEGMVAKVADFGLTRDLYTTNVYEKKSGGKVPVKWLAVESLEQGLYTSQSDVWSFGVLLWEIETGGCTPYAGISTRELLPHLKAGNRLEKPYYCSPELYGVMLGCWNANPKNRPTFEELSDELRQMRTKVTEYLTPVEMEPSNDYLTVIL